MTITEAVSKRVKAGDHEVAKPLDPVSSSRARPRRRIFPILWTLAVVVVAIPLSLAMWDAYMAAPWTRDATVRAYVVSMAPELAGYIVELHVIDNQFVHKGELLVAIEPTDYKIAVSLAEASVEQAHANAQNAQWEAERRHKLSDLAVTLEQKQICDASALSTRAQHQQALANLNQGRVNLERMQIRSPVTGYVTNLMAQLGDYASVGKGTISVVDADSFWIDGYFQETQMGAIHKDDPATIQLMGYSQVDRGHVGSIARA